MVFLRTPPMSIQTASYLALLYIVHHRTSGQRVHNVRRRTLFHKATGDRSHTYTYVPSRTTRTTSLTTVGTLLGLYPQNDFEWKSEAVFIIPRAGEADEFLYSFCQCQTQKDFGRCDPRTMTCIRRGADGLSPDSGVWPIQSRDNSEMSGVTSPGRTVPFHYAFAIVGAVVWAAISDEEHVQPCTKRRLRSTCKACVWKSNRTVGFLSRTKAGHLSKAALRQRHNDLGGAEPGLASLWYVPRSRAVAFRLRRFGSLGTERFMGACPWPPTVRGNGESMFFIRDSCADTIALSVKRTEAPGRVIRSTARAVRGIIVHAIEGAS
ncbi:uncharacterized protein B0H18DRAFT_493425 [Fomitopsis serialis]|uniref:uncharacterized protein n=1 Tax=Fomitopsis serialis TaxID=139415 RepID=UPI00200870C7|nr:uncharacterized protein B0H18DRAFT_493425 [Neoantrodia serialis]KAH9934937.1 hypothetical protein B0H18DRAFT_493425 [Neoantrodia serialis]